MSDIEQLIAVARDREAGAFRRRTAVSDLVRTKEPRVVDTLALLLNEQDQYLRREVVSGLIQIGDASVVEPLVRALADDDDYVQQDAAEALGRLGDQRAVDPLTTLLEDNSYSVRDAARRALEQIQRRASTAPRRAAVTRAPAVRSAAPLVSPAAFDKTTTGAAAAPVAPAEPPSPGAPTVAAELAGEPPQVETTVDRLAAQPETAPPGERIDWEGARRFQALCGDAVSQIRSLYEGLAEQRGQLADVERRYHEAVERLNEDRAANQGDLTRTEKAIDAAKEQLGKYKREAARARREKMRLERQAHSFSFQITKMFSSEQAREHQQRRVKLASEIHRLDGQADEASAQLQALEQQEEELSSPLRQLQEQIETMGEARRSAWQAVGAVEREIDAWFVDYLERLPAEELRARLQRLAEMSADEAFFPRCADELLHSLAELAASKTELEQTQSQLRNAATAAAQSTEALGAAIASGFHAASIERRTPVRLSGSVDFREEHSLLGGYRGADGSASGSGTGHASYTIEEVRWQPPVAFESQVAQFAAIWTQQGEQAARRELLAAAAAAGRQRLQDVVHVVRSELEQDFPKEQL
jgi:uncharacterized coiled-coil DUF342 family protein